MDTTMFDSFSWADWASLILIVLSICYLVCNTIEWVISLLYDFGYCRAKYSLSRTRKAQAIDYFARAFNLSKDTCGEVYTQKLSKGYVMIIVSEDKAKTIWAEHDAKVEVGEPLCGPSSTTPQ